MKSKWFALGCLSSVFILILIIFLVFYSLARVSRSLQAETDMKTQSGSYLHLDLSGELVDYNEYKDSFFTPDLLSVHDIVHRINKAAHDDNIIGILLEPNWVKCGLADISEINLAFDKFKSNGKIVIAYLETSLNRD